LKSEMKAKSYSNYYLKVHCYRTTI